MDKVPSHCGLEYKLTSSLIGQLSRVGLGQNFYRKPPRTIQLLQEVEVGLSGLFPVPMPWHDAAGINIFQQRCKIRVMDIKTPMGLFIKLGDLALVS